MPGPHLYVPPRDTYWADGTGHYNVLGCIYNARDHQRKYGLAIDPALGDWSPQIAAAVEEYRDKGVLGVGVTSYRSFAEGIARHFNETGDPKSLEAVKRLSPGGEPGRVALDTMPVGDARPAAEALTNALATEACGLGPHPLTVTLARSVVGHMDQWSAPGPRHYGMACKPFMAGLGLHALCSFHAIYAGSHDPILADIADRIPVSINRMLDWLWETCWIPDVKAIRYQDQDTTTTPNLQPITKLKVTSAVDNRTFTGPDSLSTVDDFYQWAAIGFTSGVMSQPPDLFMCVAYEGATRKFTITPNYAPRTTVAVGDEFTLSSTSLDSSDPAGNGPAPDLNHLVAPAYAWARLVEIKAHGDTPRARLLRERFVAMFSGGLTAFAPPWAMKHWNISLYWVGEGIDAHDRADQMVAKSTSAVEPTTTVPPITPPVVNPSMPPPSPVDPIPSLPRRFFVKVNTPGMIQVDVDVDGKVSTTKLHKK